MNNPSSVSWNLLAALLLGATASWLAADAMGLLSRLAPLEFLDPGERNRRVACRRLFWFRHFEPFILRLARVYQNLAPRIMGRIESETRLVDPGPLTGAEAVALRQVQALPWAILAALLARTVLGFATFEATLIFLGLTVGLGWLLLQFTLRKARAYRRKVRARLPFALELAAVMMESGGAGVLDALRTAAEENRGHPLGLQLSMLIRDVDLGKTLIEALGDWAERYHDEDVVEAALLIRTSVERGTPLEESLRSLAEQARLRRMQRLERAAEECKVHVTWPGMVVMLACLLIVSAPFVLAARRELGY